MRNTAFVVSLAGDAARSVQRGFDAVNQDGAGERLGQKANGSDLQRAGTDALIGKGRDKNKRHVVTPRAHMSQKVQTRTDASSSMTEITESIYRTTLPGARAKRLR
jgi:hypothetical protein